MTIPTNYTFVATYNSGINANIANGSIIANPIGGAAILGYALDLAYDDYRWLDYNAISNADSAQVGTIKFMVKPNYSGMPTSGDKVFITICKVDLDPSNNLTISHSGTTSDLVIGITDATATPIIATSLGPWFPTAGQFYEFELDYDLNSGYTRLFVDGHQFGSTMTATGTRGTSIGLLRVGGTWDSLTPTSSNFTIDNLIIFNTVQHTADYTPGYCLGWAEETSPFTCYVFGFVRDANNVGLSMVRVHVTTSSKYEYGNLEVYLSDAETVTNSDGAWSINLIENTTTQISYTFTFYLNDQILKQYTDVVVPNTTNCIAFTDLI